MSSRRIPKDVQLRVQQQAGGRCGYCQSHQRYVLGRLEIDHLIPRSRGGSDREENLWLACRLCNSAKRDQTHGMDPLTGEIVPLFNPRTQKWAEHFSWSKDGARIGGRTPCGRVTVIVLQLNNLVAVMVRQAWIAAGWHPPLEEAQLRMTTTDPLEQLTNYYPISPLILTAGQPTAEQIALIGQAGCDVVINLARPSSPNALADEAELAAAHGMDYIAIPVVWEEPTLDDLARFFAAMEANRARKVFVHCVVNYRVSTFIYLYRVLRLGLDPDEAIWDLRSIWEPDETWSAFIDAALETLKQ